MFNRPNRRDVNEGIENINNDIKQLADSLEEVLKSWGSDAKDEAESARRKAQALLKETRARMHDRNRVQQVARDAVGCADTFVKDNPWCSVGAAAAIGIFVGALLSLRR
ncbi:MAG: rane protein [Proteobacteria bacterium]|nr:rane protein [Pseudomonadota bacterium]